MASRYRGAGAGLLMLAGGAVAIRLPGAFRRGFARSAVSRAARASPQRINIVCRTCGEKIFLIAKGSFLLALNVVDKFPVPF